MEVYSLSNNFDTVMHFMTERLLRACGHGGPMNAFPGPNSVLVLDNASIHHADRDLLKDLCESKGVRVEFLPPYSPDLNPIEEFFSACKHRIRRDYHQLTGSDTPVDDLKSIFSCVGSAQNAWGWIQHCGYWAGPGADMAGGTGVCVWVCACARACTHALLLCCAGSCTFKVAFHSDLSSTALFFAARDRVHFR